jgi:hypothetical protein
MVSKKSNAGSITIFDFKLYYKAIAIKTAWYWHKNRHEDQWKRTEAPDMSPHNYTHLIFDKGAKIYDAEKTTMLLGKVVIHLQETKILPCTSTNSKCIKDLNIRPKTSEVSIERSRKHSGTNRYRQGLPQ